MRVALIHAVAMAAARRGDMTAHNALLRDAAQRPELAECDALMLAQVSMAPAAAAVEAAARVPVLTSPESAVRKLKRLLA